MASRRWIPVLASALMLAAIGVGVLVLLRVAPQLVVGRHPRYKPPVMIAVEATYPGASAQVVAESIAIPLEQQVNGVENMVSMSSQCSGDGRYLLQVTFRDGTDPNVAQVLVQNRVSLSVPALPPIVQHNGMPVRKVVPQPIALISLVSPDDRYDRFYLSNFAAINIQPELARMPGVGEVVPFGTSDGQHRLLIDPDQLAAHDMTVLDVSNALKPTSLLQPAAGQQIEIKVEPRTSIEQFAEIILKADPEGNILRLRDIARIQTGAAGGSHASLDGQLAVVLAVYPLPDAHLCDVSRALAAKLAELRATFPPGLIGEVSFDFAPNLDPRSCPSIGEHLVIDVDLPEGATAERTAKTLAQAAQLLRKASGVTRVVALTEHPFALIRSRPCLVVGLSPKSLDRTLLAARLLQRSIAAAEFRFSIPSADGLIPVYGFPIEFVIEDRGDQGPEALLNTARTVVEQLVASGKFTDVDQSLRSAAVVTVDLDRSRCVALGLDVGRVSEAMQVALGSAEIGKIEQFGRTAPVHAGIDAATRDQTLLLENVRVRNEQGQLVPLSVVATVRRTTGPGVIERHNLYPAARVTANVAPGVSFDEARKLCESLAAPELGVSFKIVWVKPAPPRQ